MQSFIDVTYMVLGAAMVLTLLAPFWMLVRTRDDTEGIARRRALRAAACGVAVTGLIAARVSGLSFNVAALNGLTAAGFLAAAGALAVYAFTLKPRPAWIVVGLLDAAAWCVMLLSTLLATVFAYESRDPIDLGGGLYCRESASGPVSGAVGYEFDIFRRYLVVERRIYQRDRDNYSADESSVPASVREAAARCRALLEQQ